MAAQKGRLVLLKVYNVGANTSNSATANAVATARTTELTINSEAVDVTAKDTNGWRELAQDAGMKSMTISLEGVFKDAAYEEILRAHSHSGNVFAAVVVTGNGDEWSGNFHIPTYSRSGVYNGEETFSLTLESAGEITFTPGA